MLRKSIISAALCLLSFSASFAQTNRYEVKFDDFTQLKMRDNININYKSNPDSAGMAVFYSTAEVAPHIVFSSNKGKLTVEFANKKNKPANPPTVTVYSRFITLAENQSDSTITLSNVNSGPQLKLRVMGNGKLIAEDLNAVEVSASITTGNGLLVVSGNCDKANITNMSTGTVQADKLIAKDIKCKLIGTGSIGCTPLNYLSIAGAGTGKVYYFGSPKTIENNAIKIKLIAMDEQE